MKFGDVSMPEALYQTAAVLIWLKNNDHPSSSDAF